MISSDREVVFEHYKKLVNKARQEGCLNWATSKAFDRGILVLVKNMLKDYEVLLVTNEGQTVVVYRADNLLIKPDLENDIDIRGPFQQQLNKQYLDFQDFHGVVDVLKKFIPHWRFEQYSYFESENAGRF